jgi:type I restriction enzyme M protein
MPLKLEPVQSRDSVREWERIETRSPVGPDRRWRCYDDEDVLKRDKLSLDFFWGQDRGLTNMDDLLAPGITPAEVVDDLDSALEQFATITARLE